MIIAVDGPTASGKGMIAIALGAHFALPVLDTGLLYRAVGHQTIAKGGDPDNPAHALDACNFDDALLDNPALRRETTGGLASRVSVHPQVREALLERQRLFARQPGGAVLDGRDIGTIVVPDADVKLFITASVGARAQRRWLEMSRHDQGIARDEIERDIAARDSRDMQRTASPLCVAQDALVIDTTTMERSEAIAAAIQAVNGALRP